MLLSIVDSTLFHDNWYEMDGRCQRSTVHFTMPTATPLEVYICHCLECRHQSSSAFGISAIFPAFEVPKDMSMHLTVYSRHTATGKDLKCYFCKHCGSRIMHANDRTTISVKGACLERFTRDMLAQATHIWTKRAVVDILDGAKSFDEEPPE